jgi:uncharacterized protein
VLSAANVAGLAELVGLACYAGNVGGIALDSLRPFGRALEAGIQPAGTEDVARYLPVAFARAEKLAALGARLIVFRELRRVQRLLISHGRPVHHCYFDAGQSLMVTPSGEVYPCASLAGQPRYCLGHIQDSDFAAGLPDRLAQVRQTIPMRRGCLGCSVRPYCDGGCAAQALASAGEWSAADCAIRQVCLDYLLARTPTG